MPQFELKESRRHLKLRWVVFLGLLLSMSVWGKNHFFRITPAVFLCGLIGATLLFGAGETPDSTPPPIVEHERLPGISLAEGVSQMTGVAISPLLGVSAMGAWKYWRTDSSQRHLLPWFCKPVSWGIGLTILVLIFLKDSIGAAAPLVKKPLDLVELFESKCSAVIASAAFVPFVAEQMTMNFSDDPVSASAAGSAEPLLATVPMVFSMHFLLVPICIFGFLMVWVVSHALNVLILISPFGLIDAFLKSTRLLLLSSIGFLYAISPILAAILSVIVIVVAAFLAPTAFRLSVFGSVMSIDYLMSIFKKDRSTERVYGFLAKRGNDRLKTRCFGTIERSGDDDRVVFKSKFCFFGPTRSLVLPETQNLAITRGFLYPSLSMTDPQSGKNQVIVNLLPRFRPCVKETSEKLGVSQILDTSITRGLKAMWQWFRDILINSRDRLVDVATVAKNRALPPPPTISE